MSEASDGAPGLASALRRLAAARDDAAWTAVLTVAGPDMLALARRLTGDAALADDALQEALLLIRDHARAFRGADEARGDGEAVARAWILRVTASAALQLVRRAARRRRRERAALEDAERAALVRRSLAGLPERQRLPLTLHYFAGLDHQRVAAALGWPLGTVKTGIHRGIAALRTRLAPHGAALSLALLTGELQRLGGQAVATTPGGALAAAGRLLHAAVRPRTPWPAVSTAGGGAALLGAALAAALAAVAGGAIWLRGAGAEPPAPAPPAAPPALVEHPADSGGSTVAILGDFHSAKDLGAIRARLAVIHGPGSAPDARPDAIELATEVDLGPGLDRFAALDALVALARDEGVGLWLRVKPKVAGDFAKVVVRETKVGKTGAYHELDQPSFCDPAYAAATTRYFAAVAAHFAPVPTVLGVGVAIGPSGETQYPIAGTAFGDFSAPALADYRAWMARLGRTVTDWPELPGLVTADTRIARDGDYSLWALWRAQVLAEVLGRSAQAIHAAAPRLQVGTFSYLESAGPAGYGPGFVAAEPAFSWVFSGISLDHGYAGKRGLDRSRPVAMPGRLLNAAEFDLISAYTDPAHAESYARYLALMGGQARPFLPTWWGPGKSGGWAESFWTPYSDDVARRLCGLVHAAAALRGAASVADVAVISPDLSGMGAMANWGPWTSEEWRQCHSDVLRQLTAIGANVDVLSEAALTAGMLKPYRLVVVLGPALYPWVRTALAGCSAHVLALGWAGTVTAPGPGDLAADNAWFNDHPTWWPSHGTVVRRPARVRFAADPRLGALAGQERAWEKPTSPIAYLRDLLGTPLARDDEGRAVATVLPWGARRLYHIGIPFALREPGRLLDDGAIRALLTGILHDAGCTAYGDLGPLRLYENARWLLVENPNGTQGTVAEPRGDFHGTIQDLLKHRPPVERIMADKRIGVEVPAGGSIVIPLR